MNHDLMVVQWINHQHGNAQFLKQSPRTAREAYGHDLEGTYRREDAFVLIVALVGFLLGLWIVY